MIRRAHRTRIGRCAMARGGLTRAHLTSHEHLWLALAVVHAPPHRGHFASRVHPIRRSLMAQNSPNGRPPTPRKLLVFRHALGYDSSERPNAAISGTAEIRAKIGHRHWPKSRGFGHATFNAEKRRLSSPFDHNGQRGFWPGQKEKGIANHETNKAIIPLCPKITRISAIPIYDRVRQAD
jgi:hypothetical protein